MLAYFFLTAGSESVCNQQEEALCFLLLLRKHLGGSARNNFIPKVMGTDFPYL